MAEHIGEWHTLTVNDPTHTDDVMELDHPASCPLIPADENDGIGTSYGCSLADEVANCGFENFEAPEGGLLTPGVYQVRFRAWSSYSRYYGSQEWDSCVEAERHASASSVATQ